jgi:NTP pyrophosphatase (non-canonical NTP hydrolase)
MSNCLNELSQKIYQANKAKGFWDKERNVGEMLMLVVSELAEGLEAHREGKIIDGEAGLEEEYALGENKDIKYLYEKHIKGSFQEEIADAIIRLLDISAGLNIDIDKHVELKLKYNATRAKMHGKKY